MNTRLSQDEALLDPSLKLRALKLSDAEPVAQLIYDACVADGDAILAESPEELLHEWQNPGFNVDTDGFIVETEDGHIVGYSAVVDVAENAVFEILGNGHPNFKGLGIGTTMVRCIEKRASQMMAGAQPDVRVVLKTTINQKDTAGIALLQNEGYLPAQYHWRMEINLKDTPPAPNFPAGIELRPFVQGEQDEAILRAHNEAFRIHPGHVDMSLEEWRRYRYDDPEFDPTLWMIAWDGGEIAAYSINRYRTGIGWIRSLGVRPAWRKHGLGEALLYQSFGEYYRRGMKTIGLGVNANNPTGATRLYQKVGMHAASEHVTYEKELRSGRKLEQ
ncbi:MAG: GNAT family N-acetyltransferase [Anaerolineales bacterium]